MTDRASESDNGTGTQEKIEEMGLHRSGVLFEIGESEFLTRERQETDAISVVRLEDASRDTLDPDRLYESFEAGELRLLSTYDTSTEVAVPRMTLAIVTDAAADHVANHEGEYQDDVRGAVDSAREELADE